MLVGEQFERLTVISLIAPDKRGKRRVACVCACGSTIAVSTDKLKSGHTRSCGCLARDQLRARQTRHGHYYEPEHLVWRNMHKRCNDARYARWYGGVKVCLQWADYKTFLADVGAKPSKTATLDRIDPKGDYEPANVRWTTRATQARNTKNHCTNKTGARGISWSKEKKKWRAAIYVDNKQKHVGYFADVQDAIAARKEAEEKYWGEAEALK